MIPVAIFDIIEVGLLIAILIVVTRR